MNLLSFFHKPEPAPEAVVHRSLSTGQFIPSRKEQQRRANAASVRMQLELMKAVTPAEQFREAIARASCRVSRTIEEGR